MFFTIKFDTIMLGWSIEYMEELLVIISKIMPFPISHMAEATAKATASQSPRSQIICFRLKCHNHFIKTGHKNKSVCILST